MLWLGLKVEATTNDKKKSCQTHTAPCCTKYAPRQVQTMMINVYAPRRARFRSAIQFSRIGRFDKDRSVGLLKAIFYDKPRTSNISTPSPTLNSRSRRLVQKSFSNICNILTYFGKDLRRHPLKVVQVPEKYRSIY